MNIRMQEEKENRSQGPDWTEGVIDLNRLDWWREGGMNGGTGGYC